MRKITESAQNELRVSLSQKERSLQGTEEKLSSQNPSKLIYPKFPESKSLIVLSTIKRKSLVTIPAHPREYPVPGRRITRIETRLDCIDGKKSFINDLNSLHFFHGCKMLATNILSKLSQFQACQTDSQTKLTKNIL